LINIDIVLTKEVKRSECSEIAMQQEFPRGRDKPKNNFLYISAERKRF